MEGNEFGEVVGSSYGMAEAQMGRELYETNLITGGAISDYWTAKAKFWSVVSGTLALVAFLGFVAGATAIVKWWF